MKYSRSMIKLFVSILSIPESPIVIEADENFADGCKRGASLIVLMDDISIEDRT
jgi:hypothetical protein